MSESLSHDWGQIELFENAFRNAPIGMALVCPKGSFLKINDAFCRLVGYSQAEMLALDFQTITHADDLKADLVDLGRLAAGEITDYQMDKRYIRADGAIVWVNLSVSAVRKPNGEVLNFIAQVQDLTLRRETEAKYRLMAENTTDIVVTTDMAGIITYVSPAVFAVTGWRPSEMIGERPIDYAHPSDAPKLKAIFKRLAAGAQGEPLRWRGRHKDGNRWVWLESNPSRLGGDLAVHQGHFLDVIRDVTANVEQERALQAATHAAEAAAAAKSDFLANMSHEIRTPLTAVLGFAALLASRTDLSEPVRQYVDRIDSASESLLAIVNDVLDFSKLEAGQFEIRPKANDPAEVAAGAVSILRAAAAAKGLSLDLTISRSVPARAMLDADRVRQVLLNLVGNAIKFTDAGGVAIALDYAQDRLTCAVADTGGGITPEDQERLFQRFTQIDETSTRRYGGTGLGLAICKGLVESMGGAISVTSAVGRGSRFVFDIAAPAAADESATGETSNALSTLGGVRILVVDDNRVNRELVTAILGAFGAQLDEAENGEIALDMAGLSVYDVILMDIRMPVMGGVEALERLRASDGPNQWTPVIAFSAGADVTAHLADGFDACVAKPINPGQLTAALETCLCGPEADERLMGRSGS